MMLYQRSKTLPRIDHDLIVENAKGAKIALEFGPGASTFALIEAGVEKIVSYEHDETWREKAKETFKDYPQVEIRAYGNTPEIEIEGDYDFAFVDSPKGYLGARVIHPGQEDCSRFNTTLAAVRHAKVTLLHDAVRPLERGTLGRISALGYKVTFLNAAYGMARIDDKDAN